MERLTIRNSDGTVSQPTGTTVEAVFYRLADYEDTNREPASMNCVLCAADTSRNTKEPAADAGGKNLCDRR